MTTVAHEVRNPLTGVIGLADSLVESWDQLEESEARELASLISAEAHAIEAIIEDLLDLGRLGSGSMRVETSAIDLAGLVRDLDSSAMGEAEVLADPGRVTQIVRNLLDNASNHGGGTTTVEVGSDNGIGWLEVRDDGEEIPVEVAGRIFDPFVSTGGGRSTGLGLAVSRELANAMAGDISYARRENWTVFRLELPTASGTTRPPLVD